MRQLSCPNCGEDDQVSGRSRGDLIELTCGSCGHSWTRDPAPACPTCGRKDLHPAVAAIVEKSRGTQLSIVGTRDIALCPTCDSETIERYERNRPNPIMPDELPTTEA